MLVASCLHPEVTSKGIREGVADALRNVSRREPHRPDAELNYTFECNSTTIASICECIPGAAKPTPRTTEYRASSASEAMP
jgi:D-aminopeptidase